jgi:hypothetical protein
MWEVVPVPDWRIVYAQLAAFDDKREVLLALRRGIREPLPQIRKAIRDRAIETLPHRGGLGAWVAASRVNGPVAVSGRRIRLKIKAGRNSRGGRSDIDAIDRGRVRAPTWGHRGLGAWHTEIVEPGFFTKPAQEAAEPIGGAMSRAVDQAFDRLAG